MLFGNGHIISKDDTLIGLGKGLIRRGQWAEAESVLRESLSLQGSLKTDRYSYKRYLLGDALAGQGKFAEAEPLILEGYEGLRPYARAYAEVQPRYRRLLNEAAEQVVRLYQAWGKPDQAKSWAVKLGRHDLPADVFAQP